MTRVLVSVILLLIASVPLRAQPAVFQPEGGLANAIAAYEALAEPTPSEQLGLAAARFLHGIERTLQMRYRANAAMDEIGLPVLRLPIPPNPDPEPFEPALVADIFREVAGQMERTRHDLGAIPDDADVTLEIDIAALWFDVNENASREPGEGLFEVAGALLDGPGPGDNTQPPQTLIVRFDRADIAWLAAYTHLLSGISELVLAFDPTDVIADVWETSAAFEELRGPARPARRYLSQDDEYFADLIAIFYGAVNRVPDAERTRAARAHFLGMVAENREFWARVAEETDDDAEWIPNDDQHAALGFALPKGIGETWKRVLGDAEAVLNGELLVGHWRMGGTGGVNVAKLMQDPPAVDIVTWFQGQGLLPYLENGPLIESRNLRMFERMVGGNTILFMVLLN